MTDDEARAILDRNRAICGYCQVLQRTNPGEWCIAHQDDVPPPANDVPGDAAFEEAADDVPGDAR